MQLRERPSRTNTQDSSNKHVEAEEHLKLCKAYVRFYELTFWGCFGFFDLSQMTEQQTRFELFQGLKILSLGWTVYYSAS